MDRWAWRGVFCWACTATILAMRRPVGIGYRSAPSPSWHAGGLATGDNVMSLAESAGQSAKEASGLYGIYMETLRDAKYIDLTHAFSPKIPVWEGFGPAQFGSAVAGRTMDGFVEVGETFSYANHGFQAGTYTLTTDQYGTQLDPPAHWNEYGATISDLPPTFAVRPLVVLDVHAKVKRNASYHATVADAKAWEAKHGRIPEGSVVMVRSDWSRAWKTYKKKGVPANFSGVALTLLKFLHMERDILFHGHEPLDTDMSPTLEGEAWLMHNNFAQAEGVANLDQVPEHGCLVSIGFAKPEGGLGGLARFVAICPAYTQAGVSVSESPGAPLPKQRHPLRRNKDGVMVPTPSATATKYCSGAGSLGCQDGKPTWQ